MFSTNTQQKQWFIRKQKTKYIQDIKCIHYCNHAIRPCFKLREKKKERSVPLFFHLQHFPSSKIALNILKITCRKQSQYRERFESLPGKPPCTIAVPACTSRYLHSWQTFSAVSSSNPHTGSVLVFLLTTLGLFFWDFSLLKGKPSVWFYYEMPSIILISSYPQANSYICQQMKAAYASMQGAADPWFPTSDPLMLHGCCLCTAWLC